MSKRVFVRGLSVLCTFAMFGSVAGTSMAQQVPVRVVQGSDGTLYVVKASSSWTLVPDQASDSEVAALDPSGEIDGTFPNELLVVQEPVPPPNAPPPAAALSIPASPFAANVEGMWIGGYVSDPRFVIKLDLHASGNDVSGTWRADTADGRTYVIYQVEGTVNAGMLPLKAPSIVQQSAPPGNFCAPGSANPTLSLSQNELTGSVSGCGAGTVKFKRP